jgi:hypothetical protein
MRVASRLTARDRSILHMLRKHRVLTTDQITTLFFANVNTAQHRLTKLYQMRLVDRFQPLSGRYVLGPNHYVLDQAGAMVLAAERDDETDLAKVHWRTEQALAVGRSQRLAHQLGVNDFFIGLAAAARRDPQRMRLDLWWSEAKCHHEWGKVVQPDGFGIWCQDDTATRFYLEYDRSTEPLSRLVDKLGAYETMERALGDSAWLLFDFRTSRREAGARAALADATVPIATAARGPTQPPCEPVWAPLGHAGLRLRLIDLEAYPHPPESDRRVREERQRRERERRLSEPSA